MNKVKSFDIPKQLVFKAYQKVAQNKGSAGVDDISLQDFAKNLKDNLYKLWNRMSSGSYFPSPVKTVLIPKKDGGQRPLGIPTVTDRIAQTVVALALESELEPHFDEDSYGYRPRKSALDAIGKARQRCWKYQWVVDLDIKGFFDNLNHELLLRAVEKHCSSSWVLFYVKRWLKANVAQVDGTLVSREKGTPQGGVISPLLANLFLHYAFDKWMRKNNPSFPFERYADDIVVHCKSKQQAEFIKQAIEQRLAECKLSLNQQKTQIVYCGASKRREDSTVRKFNFLGYTFRPRKTRTQQGKYFVGFLPAISNEAKRSIRQTIRRWRMHRWMGESIETLAKRINPYIRGWINYYGKFYRSEIMPPLEQVEIYLKRWVQNKFRKKTGLLGIMEALKYIGRVRRYRPYLFEHWRCGLGSPIV